MTTMISTSPSLTMNKNVRYDKYVHILNITHLHFDIPHDISSFFIVSHLAYATMVCITLQRLKFPSNDRYIYRISFI
nr:MAG TPA: hypothetical protein [Herelleviridae sp.]